MTSLLNVVYLIFQLIFLRYESNIYWFFPRPTKLIGWNVHFRLAEYVRYNFFFSPFHWLFSVAVDLRFHSSEGLGQKLLHQRVMLLNGYWNLYALSRTFQNIYPCHLQNEGRKLPQVTITRMKNYLLVIVWSVLTGKFLLLLCVLTLFLEVFPALPENAYKKEYLIIWGIFWWAEQFCWD